MKRPVDILAISIVNGSHSSFPARQMAVSVLEVFKVPFEAWVLSLLQIKHKTVILDGSQIVALKRGTTWGVA